MQIQSANTHMNYVYLLIFATGALWTLYSIFFSDTKEKGKIGHLKMERDLLLLVICSYLVFQLSTHLFRN